MTIESIYYLEPGLELTGGLGGLNPPSSGLDLLALDPSLFKFCVVYFGGGIMSYLPSSIGKERVIDSVCFFEKIFPFAPPSPSPLGRVFSPSSKKDKFSQLKPLTPLAVF
jgi:hypothetical protein